jgi:hypothetical protein
MTRVRAAVNSLYHEHNEETLMIAKRRTWLYRMTGQRFVHTITFKRAVTASVVRQALAKIAGGPLELWACNGDDALRDGRWAN